MENCLIQNMSRSKKQNSPNTIMGTIQLELKTMARFGTLDRKTGMRIEGKSKYR
jgi:hypothetical protein